MIKKTIIIIVVLLASVVLIGFNYLNKENNTTSKNSDLVSKQSTKSEEVKADLNGDGKQEILRLNYTMEKKFPTDFSLIAYDLNGNEIGSLPQNASIPIPISGNENVYNPITSEKKQIVSFEFYAGPHSSETLFFGLYKLKDKRIGILPICSSNNNNGSCLFWSGEIGELLVRDIDNDGYLELIETVYEYPKDGNLTTDLEKIIEDTWKNEGKETIDGAKRIAKREQGGRGNKVIWGIYHFNNDYFVTQNREDYSRYFNLAKQYLKTSYPNYPEVVSKNEISQDSIDYNEFVRKFWTRSD